MDPAETLRLIAVLITDGELDDAQELSNAYTEWRQRGGFQPPGGDAKLQKLNARLQKAISKAFAKGFRPEVQPVEPFTRHPADVRYENKSRARKSAKRKRVSDSYRIDPETGLKHVVFDRGRAFKVGDTVKPSEAYVATSWPSHRRGTEAQRSTQARLRKLRGTVTEVGPTYGELTSYEVRWSDGSTTGHNQTMFERVGARRKAAKKTRAPLQYRAIKYLRDIDDAEPVVRVSSRPSWHNSRAEAVRDAIYDYVPHSRAFYGIEDSRGKRKELTEKQYEKAEATYYKTMQARDARGVWG
jgi:hypothetical protein